MIEKAKLPDFQKFCKRQFHLEKQLGNIEDNRESPQIETSTIAEAVVFMGALGLGSLLQCDQTLRTEVGLIWFGQETPAVSDTTMARSLEGMDISSIRPILSAAYRHARDAGESKWEGVLGTYRVGVVDGSSFGQFQASCFEIVGQIAMMVDLEEIVKRGKELPASSTLLRRVNKELGSGVVDVVLGDGLYFNAPFFNLNLEELHWDVLVKTDDARRDVIVDAMGLFQCPSFGAADGLVRTDGLDVERMCEYQICLADGFEMEGVAEPVSVAWVHEIPLKKGDPIDFWVIFTQRYRLHLTSEEAREFGHLRWDIENHGFKSLNQTVRTKHLYSHNSTAMLAITMLLCVVFTWLQLFMNVVWTVVQTCYPGMKMTQKFVYAEIRRALLFSVHSRAESDAYTTREC